MKLNKPFMIIPFLFFLGIGLFLFISSYFQIFTRDNVVITGYFFGLVFICMSLFPLVTIFDLEDQ